MTSTTTSPNLQSILDAALDIYARQTGIDLTRHPSAEEFQSCRSPEDIIQLLHKRENAFRDYKAGHQLFDLLGPVIQALHSAIVEINVLPVVPFQLIFVGIDVLLAAAISVGGSYDALIDLFECIGCFLSRLDVYVKNIPFSYPMAVTMVKIMVEVLTVLTLATKQVRQGRLRTFARKLLKDHEVEDVLRRLDRLTRDEARMTATQTLEVVHGLVSNVKVVMDDGTASTKEIREALVTMQEIVNDINKINRDQLQRDIRSWLSPPDPSEDYNNARRYHHDGTATWFIQGTTFEEWIARGCILWVHGKPGSGKSIFCSSIINEVKERCETGVAFMAYFYCSFTAKAKQDVRGLLTSLIAQLCAESDACYGIISALYKKYNAGSQQPDDDALMKCFKDMLNLPGRPKIYIIMDALDECPNTDIVSPRERVLKFVKELCLLRVPTLRIFLTSRSEADIEADLLSLKSHCVSVCLHDQWGQKQDIANYVWSFVHSDRNMRELKAKDRELVINTLLEKADGMFKWVVYQLENLRQCFPATLQDELDILPKSLEETYKRILLRIDRAKRKCAYRLFQCLTVSERPLRVEELAQVLSIRFHDQNPPEYHQDWSVKNAHGAILSACSSLISIVNVDGSPVVQFSHFSVKEYLTSDRLEVAGGDLSLFFIHPPAAHMTLAQASLSILLEQDQVDRDGMEHFPLAIYAAQYWVLHAHLGNVSASINNLIERLFDPERPYFATWVWIYDMDYPFRERMSTAHPLETPPETVPLYYATLCGFYNPVRHLITVSPQDVNARGGYHATPFHAALAKGYTNIAILLLEHGADINALDNDHLSPLHRASRNGRCDEVKFLLDHGANINVRNEDEQTPLHLASCEGEIQVTETLLGRGAAVDPRSDDGWTPLMAASRYGHLNVVRLLLENGATVASCNNDNWSPSMLALHYGKFDVAELLGQWARAIGFQEDRLPTPDTLAQQVSEHPDPSKRSSGQDLNVPDNEGNSSLHSASKEGNLSVIQSLLDRGADVNERNENNLQTPLDVASKEGKLEVAELLIEHGADVNSRDRTGWTPLHKASRFGHLGIVRLLLDNGADVDAQKHDEWTPLHLAISNHYSEIVELLLERRAKAHIRTVEGWTPHEVAVRRGGAGDIVDMLSTYCGHGTMPVDGMLYGGGADFGGTRGLYSQGQEVQD